MKRAWTLKETLFVRDYAGTVPLMELSRHLHRDPRDVAGECGRLGVPFVYVGTPLFWCDQCASWAFRLDRSGRCLKCRTRFYTNKVENRASGLLKRATPEIRRIYADREAERGGVLYVTPPRLPDTAQMPPRAAVVAHTAYLAERSHWEYQSERRVYKAAQKRKERIARKVKALGGAKE